MGSEFIAHLGYHHNPVQILTSYLNNLNMSVKLISTSPDPEEIKWRLGRLHAVDVIASEVLFYHFPDGDHPGIISVQDHKGDLTVTWAAEPTTEAMFFISHIWPLFGEPDTNVSHTWDGA